MKNQYYITFPRKNTFELFLKEDGELSNENTPLSQAWIFESKETAEHIIKQNDWINAKVDQFTELDETGTTFK
jgi:hypothetical protein